MLPPQVLPQWTEWPPRGPQRRSPKITGKSATLAGRVSCRFSARPDTCHDSGGGRAQPSARVPSGAWAPGALTYAGRGPPNTRPAWKRSPRFPLLSGSLVPNRSAVLVSLRFLVILFYHGHGASFMFIRTFLEEHKRFTSILIPIWTLNPKCSSYLGEPVLLRGLLSP